MFFLSSISHIFVFIDNNIHKNETHKNNVFLIYLSGEKVKTGTCIIRPMMLVYLRYKHPWKSVYNLALMITFQYKLRGFQQQVIMFKFYPKTAQPH